MLLEQSKTTKVTFSLLPAYSLSSQESASEILLLQLPAKCCPAALDMIQRSTMQTTEGHRFHVSPTCRTTMTFQCSHIQKYSHQLLLS